MRTLADLLIIALVALISYRVGHFMGIYDYVQMVEKWAKKGRRKWITKTKNIWICSLKP